MYVIYWQWFNVVVVAVVVLLLLVVVVIVVVVVLIVNFISERIQLWYRKVKTFWIYPYTHDIEKLLYSAVVIREALRLIQLTTKNIYFIYKTLSLFKAYARIPFYFT